MPSRGSGATSVAVMGKLRVSVGLPTDFVSVGEFLTVAGIARAARCIEEAGLDACFASDHPFPDDKWMSKGGHHTLDPFVTLGVAAASTKRVRLHTNLIVAGYRNAFITAKAASTLDVASGGRLIMGMGAGYVEGEFLAVGAHYETRGRAVEETIVAMRKAWSGESVDRQDGSGSNTMLPATLNDGGPPIWIGGNSKTAIHRVVALAQGWSPMPSPKSGSRFFSTPGIETISDLATRIEWMRDLARRSGRVDAIDVAFPAAGLDGLAKGALNVDQFASEAKQLESVGVTWLVVMIQAKSLNSYCAQVTELGEAVSAL